VHGGAEASIRAPDNLLHPMVSSSATKRAARLAQKGKGKRVRFQGGTLFPMLVLAILVIGVGTIVYARASVPAADASPPTIEDHWHMAYGFSLCDQPDTFVQLNGNLEDQTNPHFNDYNRTGVHSHDDGVIHWHPFTAASVGKRADLGLFLENYGVELTDERLTFPSDQNEGKEYVEGETKCPGDEDGELSVTVWSSPEDTSSGDRYVSGFDDIKLQKNSLVLTISFQPRDTPATMPPWAAQLEELGAVDGGQTAPGDTTNTGSTTPAGSSTPSGSTVPSASSTPAVGEPSDATTPATTVAPATTAASATTAAG